MKYDQLFRQLSPKATAFDGDAACLSEVEASLLQQVIADESFHPLGEVEIDKTDLANYAKKMLESVPPSRGQPEETKMQSI